MYPEHSHTGERRKKQLQKKHTEMCDRFLRKEQSQSPLKIYNISKKERERIIVKL